MLGSIWTSPRTAATIGERAAGPQPAQPGPSVGTGILHFLSHMPGGPPGPCGGGQSGRARAGGRKSEDAGRRSEPSRDNNSTREATHPPCPRPQPTPRSARGSFRLRALKGHTQHRMHHIRIELRETGARGQAVREPAAAPRPLLTRAARLAAPLATRCEPALCLARLV